MELNDCCNGMICNVLIQDSVTRKRLKPENANRIILKCDCSGRSPKGFSIILSCPGFKYNKYKVDMLIGVYTKLEDDGILAFGFQNPKHDVMVITDYPGECKLFLNYLFNEMNRFNIRVNLDLRYDPGINNYLGLKHFDRKALDLSNLNVLILEKCFLPPCTKCIGNLPISYLSLTCSTLEGTEYEQDIFWDWMCMDTVGETLRILEMNKVGLKSIPFEVLYLKNLQTLSLAENQLTCIPYFIGELKNLDSLFINNNSIMYLPMSLHKKTFKDFNYSNNRFYEFDFTPSLEVKNLVPEENIRLLRRKGKPPLYSLYYLSLFTMIDNGIKIRRASLPPSLYQKLKDYGENLARCHHCTKLLIPEYSFSCFENNCINTRNLIRNDYLKWISFECNYKCNKFSDFEFNLY